MGLLESIYKLVPLLPASELYGLASQMRRSALSIPSNIAEGFGKNSLKDFRRFLRIAYGSAMELETQLTIISALGYGKPANVKEASERVTIVLRLLNGFIRSLSLKITSEKRVRRTKH